MRSKLCQEDRIPSNHEDVDVDVDVDVDGTRRMA